MIAVTYRCNCRCLMCNIWQVSNQEELPPDEYAKLPSTLRTINITGGEPFLRKDLLDVVQCISESAPRSRLVFSSNGMLTDKIVDTMIAVRSFHSRVGVGISIDGMESTHNRIRGVDGCYAKAVNTVKSLKSEGFNDLRLGMTITDVNVDQIQDVFQLSRALGVEFTATVAHNSSIYFRRTDNQPLDAYHGRLLGLQSVINSQVRSNRIKDWFRAYHLEGLIDESIRSSYTGHCSAGLRYIFLDPSGDVFPCSVMNLKIGNLVNVGALDDLFDTATSSRVRTAVRHCRNDCWMVCNTRSLISANPLGVARWIVHRRLSGRRTCK